MPNLELELNPADFITVGTVGPKGQRVFYLQAAQEDELVTLILEKFQANALAEAIDELLSELDEQHPLPASAPPLPEKPDLELREPIDPAFRIAQMGLGFDEDSGMVILVVQELLDADQESEAETGLIRPSTVRIWCSRQLLRVLAERAGTVVEKGRPEPHQNGRLINYWV